MQVCVHTIYRVDVSRFIFSNSRLMSFVKDFSRVLIKVRSVHSYCLTVRIFHDCD